MLQINNTLVSLDIIEKKFTCNLSYCKGNCCVYGDAGAPLDDEEISKLQLELHNITPFITNEGVKAINNEGIYTIDRDGDKVTVLIEGKECAFTIFENGIATCGIEKAYLAGKTTFRKPISCHLYPVRITRYPEFDAVNYHVWDICANAMNSDNKKKYPIYVFLKDALIRKYGEEWYAELHEAAQVWTNQKQAEQ